MIRAAVVGVGRLGRFHAQKYKQLSHVELAAVVDVDPMKAKEVAVECNCMAYSNYQDLPKDIDLISLAANTIFHFDIACDLLQAGKHVLIEKPMCETPEQARQLIQLASANHRLIQVGHIERFNPAVLDLLKRIDTPLFIECTRLSPFVERVGLTNTNVVLDVMIHDIDLALSLVRQPVAETATVAACVVTDDIDMINARLQFANNCVANITASRISNKQERIIRVFQKGQYMAADLTQKILRVHTIDPNNKGQHIEQKITYDDDSRDSLLQQIQSFVQAVTLGQPPLVTGEDGFNALVLAQSIQQQARQSMHTMKQ